MNEVWNLDPLYKGFDDPAFDEDITRLKELVNQFNEFSSALPKSEPLEGLREGIRLMENLTQLINRLGRYASLRQSTDTRNTECGSRLGQIMQLASTCAGAESAFREWAAKFPNLDELLEKNDVLKSYQYFFHNLCLDASYLLGAKGEDIAARLSLSGSSAWASLQKYLTSTVDVSYRGQTTNLSAIRNMAYDPDPQVRKDAYAAELKCYDSIKDPVAHALNAIKLETISDCSLRGFASPLDRTLKQSRMKRETLEAMLSSIDEYLPKFWQYLRTKGKALGHDNGLPWYDLFAPMGDSDRRYTIEETRDILIKLFSTFDRELADMAARAFDNAWIDFYPRSGKVGGAFCNRVEALEESRILTNFDGQFGDVVTLAHELGHAFHNQCIWEHRPLNRSYSMPVAETASTFNECIVMAAAIQDAQSDDEKLALIEGQLQDTCQIICDIYSRFRFEAKVFKNRENKFMDADTLCSYMLEAQRQSYGDGLNPDYLHPYMWVCKSHYYGPTFYNFPYAFGGLFARGLYARYQAEGTSFVPKYKHLLYTTTVATVEDTAKTAGIDLTDRNFWRSALQTIADQIDLFCQLIEPDN